MLDWSDAPRFGRRGSLAVAIDMLHRFRTGDVVIVETGTTRGSLGGGVDGDGWATLAFGWYCIKYGGTVYTIDILEEAIEECKVVTEPYKEVINYVVGDSTETLKSLNVAVDLLYLDSSDDPNVIYNELIAAYDKLKNTTIIVIDDTHEKCTIGKGTVAVKFLLENGWSLVKDFAGQVILIRSNMLPATGGKTVFHGYYDFHQRLAESGRLELSIEDYDDKAKAWNDILIGNLPKREELPIVNGRARVLDIGCHTGYNTKMLEEKYGYAEGIDINERLIAASKLNHDKCRIMDCTNLKYDDASFSLVVAKDVYEHSLDPTKAINESYRVLADGGMLLVIIPLDGEVEGGIDDITIHPAFCYNNKCHTWKATYRGVLNRLFDAGFTDLEHFICTHSNLFGVGRAYGDKVIVARARKKVGIKKVPTQWLLENSYWGAFIIMDCTGSCHYCIQNMSMDELIQAKKDYRKDPLSGKEWVDFYNNLQKHKLNRLSIVGGEPTLHKDFYEIVNGIVGYEKTITTNLKTPNVDNIEEFINNIEDKSSVRVNTSFHPNLISIDEFCNKIHTLRNANFLVDQVAMVNHPLSNFRHYYNEFLSRGLALSPQTFLGKMNGVLLPSDEDIADNYHEHGITNYDLYKSGFSNESKSDTLCFTRRFVVSPIGGIHRCHYHLYSNRSPIGSVRDGFPDDIPDYTRCSDFGYCNPCDFPHAKFKNVDINLTQTIAQMTQDEELAVYIVQYINENKEKLLSLVNAVVDSLYCSDSPYWTLYNDKQLLRSINEFIGSDDIIDNSNAFLLAQLDTLLFGRFSRGINIYRLLDNVTLLKYMDALGFVIYTRMTEGDAKIKDLFIAPSLVKSLDCNVAAIETSLGVSPVLIDKFTILAGGSDE